MPISSDRVFSILFKADFGQQVNFLLKENVLGGSAELDLEEFGRIDQPFLLLYSQ